MKFDPLNDGISVLEYVDHVGSDSAVVRSARVSFAGDLEEYSKERDEKLINYLAKNKHYSPFEHCSVTFNIQCPIFVARQWHRHRTFSYNEISKRYTDDDLGYYDPYPDWRKQSKDNKQGSSDERDWSVFDLNDLNTTYHETVDECYRIYREYIKMGVAKEQARMILPQSVYTRFYATGNLRNWHHFVGLRSDPHAQYEIRVFSDQIAKILGNLFPVSWKALEEA